MNKLSEKSITSFLINKNTFKSRLKDSFYDSYDYLVNKHSNVSKHKIINYGFNLNNKLNEIKISKTIFLGYEQFELQDAKILYIFEDEKKIEANKNAKLRIILDKTVFYAKGGGQNSDIGYGKSKDFSFKVYDVRKENGIFVHYIDNINGIIKENEKIKIWIDKQYRCNMASNHSATHILHYSLKKIFNNSITQCGSEIKSDSFRFDFTFFSKFNNDDANKTNIYINGLIAKNIKSKYNYLSLNEVNKNSKIEMNFLEKYTDKVRVVSFGKYSSELCSGTHVQSTKDIEAFFILNFLKKGKNIYRIIAITSWKRIYNYLKVFIEKIIKYYNHKYFVKNKININKKWLNQLIYFDNFCKNYYELLLNYNFYDLIDLVKKIEHSLLILKNKRINENKIITEKILNYKIFSLKEKKISNKIFSSKIKEILFKNKNSIIFFINECDKKNYFYLSTNIEKINCKNIFKKINTFFSIKGGGNEKYYSGIINAINYESKITEIIRNELK